MAEGTVLMLLNRLAPMIEERVREELCLMLKANNEADTLSSKLKKIQEVLMDAEQKGVMDRKVKSWLEKLQDISYDIDEVLDEWEMQNLRRQLEEAVDASESSNPWEKVTFFLQSVCLCFKQSVERRSIALNVKQLNQILDLIAQENENEFKFIPNLSHHSQDFKRIISTSFVDVSEIKGRDDDLKILMGNLLSKSGSIQILSLVGAGGMGKTTLAQLAFNDDRVQTQFIPIWVCVSHPFDEIKIAKTILEALKQSSNFSELETLLHRIKDSISVKASVKPFLLVLDDVWTENDTMWQPLKNCLIKNGLPGSRILVTTRKIATAEIMGSTHTQMQWLAKLPDSVCWLILSEIAFHERNDADRAMLKKTGLDIAQKCKGLPLAAKTLGSLLRFKTSLREWQNVLKSEVWELEKVETDLFPFLALSYNELHPAVKRCFSYCAIFPKDFEINVDALIRIWMAQGFLSSSGTVDEMELKGRDYFKDLAMRSFFQDFKIDEHMGHNHITRCKMHDIIHDFAQFLTKNECLIVKKVVVEAEMRVSGKKARHLNLLKYEAGTTMDAYSSCLIEKLCSFFCKQSKIPPTLLSQLKRVRLLSLQSCGLQDILIENGNLIHLRYLDLSGNGLLKKLPDTICDLYNLQTLDLSFCRNLFGLPPEIHKLVNLRHLLNYNTSYKFEFNRGFEKLTNLQTLSQLYCGRGHNNNKLGYLKDLNQLGGSLIIRIFDLFDEYNVVEAKKADLKKKRFIQNLSFTYLGVGVGDFELRIIEALQPPPNLLSLNFKGGWLPKWITTLTNLRILTLCDQYFKFVSWNSLSNLPYLENLTIEGGTPVEILGLEFMGIINAEAKLTPYVFPKLKKLELHRCHMLKEWEDIREEDENSYITIFPCLQQLTVYGCGNLKKLPHRLLRKVSSLQNLEVLFCTDLKERYCKGTGIDWDKISHIPNVNMRF